MCQNLPMGTLCSLPANLLYVHPIVSSTCTFCCILVKLLPKKGGLSSTAPCWAWSAHLNTDRQALESGLRFLSLRRHKGLVVSSNHFFKKLRPGLPTSQKLVMRRQGVPERGFPDLQKRSARWGAGRRRPALATPPQSQARPKDDAKARTCAARGRGRRGGAALFRDPRYRKRK